MKRKLLYEEIAEKIMTDIITGKLKHGDKVESVREMAVRLKVNPKTIQKSFEYLDEQKIFKSVPGEGRFVSAHDQKIEEIKHLLLNEEISKFVQSIDKYNISKDEIIMLIQEELAKGEKNE